MSFYSRFVFFLRIGGENSSGRPVPADSGAPVAAVRTDDDDGEQRQVRHNNKQHFRLIVSQ